MVITYCHGNHSAVKQWLKSSFIVSLVHRLRHESNYLNNVGQGPVPFPYCKLEHYFSPRVSGPQL